MLVVIAILGIIAGLTVPALKNLGKSNAQTSATRQLLDDVGRARQFAISQHTTVYMIFCPTNFWMVGGFQATWWQNLTAAQQTVATNLSDKQLTGYNFVSLRSVGDQPGRGMPRYLSEWQNLPQGSFIAQIKFGPTNTIISSTAMANAPFARWNQDYPHPDGNQMITFANFGVPFPTKDGGSVYLPGIAFNYLGQLTFDGQNLATRDEYIPLAQGSVIPQFVPGTKSFVLNNNGSPSVLETPSGNSTNISYNIVHIDRLTGRATLEYHKVQ